MSVNFATDFPQPKYIPQVTVGAVAPQPQEQAGNTQLKNDKVEIESKPKEKKSLFSKVSTFIGNIKKFFASAGEYVKGTFKGIASGAVTGSLIYTGLSIASKVSKAQKKLPAKAFGIVGAAAAFVLNIYKAYLNTNEAKASIDHKWH